MRAPRIVILTLILFITAVTSAQPPDPTAAPVNVPNLAGLTPPQAAAALNAVRLQLGSQSSATAASPQMAGKIAGQVPAAGNTVSAGSTVDIVVAYAPNIRLIYDNNDLSLINIGDQALNLRKLDFQASDAVPVHFDGQRWGRRLEPTDCVQVWSTRRTEPKSVPECRRISAWLSTTDTGQHAWKQSAGVEHFMVRQDGVSRGECPAAGSESREDSLICEIYLEQDQPAPVWPFIYLAYTSDTLVVHNTSGDRWMRLNVPVTPARGGAFSFNDVSLYKAIDGLVVSEGNSGAVLRQLAPGQCVRFRTVSAAAGTVPEPCMLFGDALVDDAPFWNAPFNIEDASGDIHVCAAAAPDVVTTCRVLR